MHTRRIITAAACVTALGACAPDDMTEPSSQAGSLERAYAAPLELLSTESGATLLDAFDTPSGSRIEFLEVTTGDAAGVLVVEHGAAGALVMDRLSAVAGRSLNAAEVYRSLVRDGATEGGTLARIAELGGAAALERPAGWALDAVGSSAPLVLAATKQVACDNGSFTGSIPGSFMPNVKKRLDTGPQFHPSIWEPYDWSGKTHYWYQAAWASNTWGWRGKVCGKAGFHPDVRYFNGWYPSVPAVKFMYRRDQSWAQAGPLIAVDGTPDAVAWIYNGELGGIDWKIMIYDAYLFDEFDVLMTWL